MLFGCLARQREARPLGTIIARGCITFTALARDSVRGARYSLVGLRPSPKRLLIFEDGGAVTPPCASTQCCARPALQKLVRIGASGRCCGPTFPPCVEFLDRAHGHADGVNHGYGLAVAHFGLALEIRGIGADMAPASGTSQGSYYRSFAAPFGPICGREVGDVEYCGNRCGAAELSSRLR